MPQDYTGVPVIPSEAKQEDDRQKFEMSEVQQKRAKYISWRISLMQNEKSKFIQRKRRALMLYDGIFRLDGNPEGAFTKEEVVAPLARIFVEAKTAEEVRAFSDFQFFPVDDENDAWRAELLMEAVDHVRRITKSKSKRHELLRMKNIIGVSVKWKGYRGTTVKMNITKEMDDEGNPTAWEEKEVPGQNEIFEDIVDPIRDFLVDPNATTMEDALDCALYFRMNHEEAQEVFGNPLFDFTGVNPGSDGMVEGVMYFKKPSGQPDIFAIYCWPSAGYGADGMKPGFSKEVYFGGLSDEHKMLPFVSYHNVPTFTQGFFDGVVSRSDSGEPATSTGSVNARQKFWAYAGDPEIIMDLIDLRTSFGRSMYRACDLASRSIVATEGNFRFDNSKDWQHGEQAIGMKGKFENVTFGVANLSAFQATLDDVYQLCIQAVGVDPRNLADSKQKTATESIAQRETSMRRLEEGLSFNEENGEIRDGIITFKLIQQHYTQPKMVRLTGAETEDELKRFDETEGEHPQTGKPLLGKQYRRIRTKKPMKEMKHSKKNMLKPTDSGTYSFIARPEYIRTSEMDVAVLTTRRAGEIRALAAAQASEGITMYSQLLPLAQPGPTGTPPLLSEEMKIKIVDAMDILIDKHMDAMGIAGKKRTKGGDEEKIEELKSLMEQRKLAIKPIVPPPTPNPELAPIAS